MYEAETNEIYRKNWGAIKTYSLIRKWSKIYNVYIRNNNIIEALKSENVKRIFLDQRYKFKINASLGFILINNTHDSLRYFHPSPNKDRLLETPMLIENLEDFQKLIAQLMDKDFIENATKSRPDTTFSVHCISNIAFFVYPMVEYPIGCPTIIPDYMKKNKAILNKNVDSNGRLFKDQQCLFRCISMAKYKKLPLKESTQRLFNEYLVAKDMPEENFKGVLLSELSFIERLFKLSINVYTLEHNGSDMVGKLIQRSTSNFKEKVNLHLFKNHFSLIKDLRLYIRSYKCEYCSKLLKPATALKRHSAVCSSQSKHIYPSGICKPSQTIFQTLKEEGIRISESLSHYPYISSYDFESYMETTDLPKNTATITYESRHRIASVSIASNIAGFRDPICFVSEGDEFQVVEKMMKYLEQLSEICYGRLKRRYHSVFNQIDKKREWIIKQETGIATDEEIDRIHNRFDKLENNLDEYLSCLPVFGFNSAAYDIPLIKKHLVKYFLDNQTDIKMIIKKGTSYISIKTDKIQFLDVSQYLAPGFSYSNYLKAYEVESQKFFWIYDKFNSLDKLRETKFLSIEDFYSNLKQQGITQEEYDYCKSVWDKNGMKTLKEFLIYYNNADVTGFIEALEKQNEFFRSKNLDFKMGISVPGLSYRWLFELKDEKAPIFYFGEKDKDLFDTIRKNIRGGLSLVFNRKQIVGSTVIKPEYFYDKAKTTRSIIGADISSMYLSNFGRDLPSGVYVRRRRENNFRIEKRYTKGQLATEWIEYIAHENNTSFLHQFNGKEKRVGGRNLPVDGFGMIDNQDVILQFSGCYFHSHMCKMAPVGKFRNDYQDLQNQIATYKNLIYLEKLGYKVIHTWECEFIKLKKENDYVNQFCKSLNFTVDTREYITEQDIITEVENGTLFGFCEVDIHVPTNLQRAFSEFQPITKHAYVSRNDIGSVMREFAEENDLLKKPSKTLLNSYFGEKMLFATPLLSWYLKHGLKITHVYQVVQYNPSKCFQRFTQEVMDARRLGDINPSKKIIGDSCKLMGKFI